MCTPFKSGILSQSQKNASHKWHAISLVLGTLSELNNWIWRKWACCYVLLKFLFFRRALFFKNLFCQGIFTFKVVYCLPIPLFSLLKNSSMIPWRLSMYKKNHQKYVIYFRKIYNKWVLLIGKKNIEDSLKNGVIITIGATGIFFGQKTLNIVKPPKTSKLGIMDIMTLTSGIC